MHAQFKWWSLCKAGRYRSTCDDRASENRFYICAAAEVFRITCRCISIPIAACFIDADHQVVCHCVCWWSPYRPEANKRLHALILSSTTGMRHQYITELIIRTTSFIRNFLSVAAFNCSQDRAVCTAVLIKTTIAATTSLPCDDIRTLTRTYLYMHPMTITDCMYKASVPIALGRTLTESIFWNFKG